MEARLCFLGYALMENRSGLLVGACLTRADGHAERMATLAMIEPLSDRPVAVMLGADRGYDVERTAGHERAASRGPERDPSLQPFRD